MRPPFDVDRIDQLTPAVVASGHRMLQTHRYSRDDATHVRLLLNALDPMMCSVVLDAGCGFGEVSRLMGEARPDLTFILANLSREQLHECLRSLPVGRHMLLWTDCHATGLRGGMVDAVMFNSALAQMDEWQALKEAHRVLGAGGRLMCNELVFDQGNERAADAAARMERELACRVLSREQLEWQVERAGFEIDAVARLLFDISHFRDLLAQRGMADLIDGMYPVIVTATKKGGA